MNSEKNIFVVGYGSNLNLEDFSSFTNSQGYFGDYLDYYKHVVIPDYKLVFNVESVSRKGGVLNIEYSVGYITYAILFKTNKEGLKLLRKKEGVPFKYQEKRIHVLDNEGYEYSALTYIVPDDRTCDFIAPHKSYLDICLKGYRDFALGNGEINLAKASVNDELKPLEALFCYGTLMREEKRFPLIKDMGIYSSIIGYCQIGHLTTNGLYPALNIETEAEYGIQGDFFCFKDISKVIEITDKIEGFNGYGKKNNLFRRSYTLIDIGGSLRESWIYVSEKKFNTKIKAWRDYNNK